MRLDCKEKKNAIYKFHCDLNKQTKKISIIAVAEFVCFVDLHYQLQ